MPDITVPNPEALKAGVAHAEANLAYWSQHIWIDVPWQVRDQLTAEVDQPPCGTTACLAGHILLSQGMSWRQIADLQEATEAFRFESNVEHAALNALGFSVDDEKRDDFGAMVFEFTDDYDYQGAISLGRTQQTLDLLKRRITEVTGITFDEEKEEIA